MPDYSITEGATNWDDPLNAALTDIDERLTAVEAVPGGQSAYDIAVANGFVGTEAEWLTSLQGADGADGADGTNGSDGTSAYETALANGFVGTESEWLDSLTGSDGATTWTALTGRPNIPGDGIYVAATGTDLTDKADNTLVFFFDVPTETLALRGHSEANTGSSATASPSITIPSNTQIGDYIQVCIGGVGNDTVNVPVGWSLELSVVTTGNTANMTVLTKIADSTDIGASVSFDWASGGTHASAVLCRVYGGADTTTPDDGVTASSTIGASTTPTAPAVTTTTDLDLAVAYFLAVDGGAAGPSWTAPSGYTNGFTTTTTRSTGANAAVAGYEKSITPAGSTGTAAATIPSAGLNRWAAALTTVQPAP